MLNRREGTIRGRNLVASKDELRFEKGFEAVSKFKQATQLGWKLPSKNVAPTMFLVHQCTVLKPGAHKRRECEELVNIEAKTKSNKRERKCFSLRLMSEGAVMKKMKQDSQNVRIERPL
ncbi:CLUMA_CG008035, isoform A [Clunio marinus]|uniref:CLUMA_CG008035, isoform A n=1 Tax=Clunio marinus TaxID=568069 RepID=A0A1J1I4L0_9DIPT|nr:CLUMA_CG008035, isoform A [Clunio marinus]